jgi:hypothetical protein
MALRIGGAKPTSPPPIEEDLTALQEEPEVMPEEMAAEPLPEEEMPVEEPAGGGEVDMIVAGYRDPSEGPFMCSNCTFFGRHGDGTCAIVSGSIDPDGLCNMFTTLSREEAPIEEPMPEEAPVEEPPVEELE